MTVTDSIFSLVKKARLAQETIQSYTQAELDRLTHAVAWAVMQPERNKLLSEMAVEETGLGRVEDKITKNYRKTLGLLRDLSGKKTTGILRKIPELGLTELARPIGVIGALVPSTNPVATPINKIINALKCGNAIVISPSPKGAKVFQKLLGFISDELKKIKAPPDLVQAMPLPPSKVDTAELMKFVDLVVVTGSQNNVRAAYSSGTPAIGVGTGNVTTIVDSSADIFETAHKIRMSKSFDNATSCSSENNVVCLAEIYDLFQDALRKEGGKILNEAEQQKLLQCLWQDGKLNPKLIAKDAQFIAKQCEIQTETKTLFLVAECPNTNLATNEQNLLARERIAPVLTLFKADNFLAAKNITKSLLQNQGAGHSLGIHTKKDSQILELAQEMPSCRVIVNQAHCFATGGAFNNGLPFSLSMGCGSWGKNSISENLNYRHYMNITRISQEIPANEPTMESILGDYIQEYG